MLKHLSLAQSQAILDVAYHDYQKVLLAHTLLRVHNRCTSEDIVQNTFLKTGKYLCQKGSIDSMKAFLYHTLNCLIIDEYRKKKSLSLDAMMSKGFDQTSEEYTRREEVLDGKRVMDLIGKLPQKYITVMRLRYEQLLPLKEIGVITGQLTNTVTVQVHRGLERLKVLYRQASIAHSI